MLRGKHIMVRVGGGWDTLQNYLIKHDPGIGFQMPRESDLIPVGFGQRPDTAGSEQSSTNIESGLLSLQTTKCGSITPGSQHSGFRSTTPTNLSTPTTMLGNRKIENNISTNTPAFMRKMAKRESLLKFRDMVLEDFGKT